jgi:hypothetical protein
MPIMPAAGEAVPSFMCRDPINCLSRLGEEVEEPFVPPEEIPPMRPASMEPQRPQVLLTGEILMQEEAAEAMGWVRAQEKDGTAFCPVLPEHVAEFVVDLAGVGIPVEPILAAAEVDILAAAVFLMEQDLPPWEVEVEAALTAEVTLPEPPVFKVEMAK